MSSHTASLALLSFSSTYDNRMQSSRYCSPTNTRSCWHVFSPALAVNMPTSTDLFNSSSIVTDHNTTIDSSDAIDTSDDDDDDDHAYEVDDELIFKQSRRVLSQYRLLRRVVPGGICSCQLWQKMENLGVSYTNVAAWLAWVPGWCIECLSVLGKCTDHFLMRQQTLPSEKIYLTFIWSGYIDGKCKRAVHCHANQHQQRQSNNEPPWMCWLAVSTTNFIPDGTRALSSKQMCSTRVRIEALWLLMKSFARCGSLYSPFQRVILYGLIFFHGKAWYNYSPFVTCCINST